MKIKDGLYVLTIDGARDKIRVKDGNIEFPTDDDMHNLDMFPEGKMSAYTQKKLQHYITAGRLKLVE